MASPTTNKGYTYPGHGAGVGTWDTNLNGNFEYQDLNLGGYYQITASSTTAAVTFGTSVATIPSTATSITFSASLAQNLFYNLTGARSQNLSINMPAAGSIYAFANNSSGVTTTTVLPTGGSGVTIPQGGQSIVVLTSTGANFANNAISDTYLVESTDAAALSGPVLDLYRNSSSPAAADSIGVIQFNGCDSAANKQLYARILAQISDPTSASEDSIIFIETQIAGTLTTLITSSGATVLIPGAATVTGAVSGGTATGSMLATQAEQETGSAVDKLVTPGRQQFHPSASKMWGQVLVSGGTPTLQAGSYNITSITDTGTGRLTVTIATDFSNALWSALFSVSTAASLYIRVATSTIAAGSIEFQSLDTGFVDPTMWCFAGFGDR